MITEEKILELAVEMDAFCQTEYENYTHSCFEFSQDELIKFAKHFYSQGLLDGANKCVETYRPFYWDKHACHEEWSVCETPAECANKLRQMAEKVGEDNADN